MSVNMMHIQATITNLSHVISLKIIEENIHNNPFYDSFKVKGSVDQ